MAHHRLIKLLMVSNQAPHINSSLSGLRSCGYKIQVDTATDKKDFSQLLSASSYDAVLYYSHNNHFTFKKLINTLSVSSKPLPIVVLYASDTESEQQHYYRKLTPYVFDEKNNDQLTAIIPLLAENNFLHQDLLLTSLQLKELNHRLEKLFQNTSIPQAYIAEGFHITCNQAYIDLFQKNNIDEILNSPILDLFENQQRPELRKALAASPQHTHNLVLSSNKEINTYTSLKLTITPEYYNQKSCLHIQIIPKAGNHSYYQEVSTINNKDLLTQLDSRQYFIEKLEGAIHCAISEYKISMLLLLRINILQEIENIKRNTSSNKILEIISNLFIELIDKPFSASRLSNYEFGILLHDHNLEETLYLAQHLKEKSYSAINEEHLGLNLRLSTGISLINGNALNADELIIRANSSDLIGNNNSTWSFRINDSLQPSIEQLANYVENALGQGKIKFLFQAIVDLKGEKLRAYEILSRILDIDGNEIPPSAYLPVANLQGLNEQLDKAVTFKIIETIYSDEKSDIPMAINITSNTIISRTFLPWLFKLLQSKPINPKLLIFQISEIELHQREEEVINFCQGLEEQGLQYSLTDFGCALNPFASLNSLSPIMVALDKSLIREIVYSNNHLKNLSTIVQDLHSLAFKVVAPNVDNLDILPMLWKIGVDFAQGFSLQRPSDEMSFTFIREKEITLEVLSAQ